MAVFFQQLVQKVAQIYEDFKDILHLMCRKGRSRKGLRYRSLMSASILGLRVILPGGCSNAVKRGFKFKYLYYVMDRTVWFVMAAPVRYLLIRWMHRCKKTFEDVRTVCISHRFPKYLWNCNTNIGGVAVMPAQVICMFKLFWRSSKDQFWMQYLRGNILTGLVWSAKYVTYLYPIELSSFILNIHLCKALMWVQHDLQYFWGSIIFFGCDHVIQSLR